MTAPHARRPEVSVVLPVFRTEGMLEKLRERLDTALAGRAVELIFVNDASPDGSAAVLERMAREHSHIRIVTHPANRGQQHAIMTGLAASRGACVVVMDADLQDPPEAVPLLLDRLRGGIGAVFAGRRGAYESGLRLLTSRLFKRTVNRLCGIPTDAGAFVAMRRGTVERILAMRPPRPFLSVLVGCTGLPSVSIPVARSARPAGKSTYSGWGRLATACRGFLCLLDCTLGGAARRAGKRRGQQAGQGRRPR